MIALAQPRFGFRAAQIETQIWLAAGQIPEQFNF
jgi:hypothetical protein